MIKMLSPIRTLDGNFSSAKHFIRDVIKFRGLMILLVPCIIWYVTFKYIPMYGVIIAFKDYKLLKGVMGSSWVGFEQFERMFRSTIFLRVTWNTMVISLYRLLLSFPAPIILAVLLNEIRTRRFKRIIQTFTYLPHFISWVIIAGLIQMALSPVDGIVNYIIGFFGIEPVNFLIKSQYFRMLVVFSGIWKEVGWGSVIYLAAITSIDPQMYDTARIDGAGRFKQIIHVTLPSIINVIVIIFLLRVGRIMDVGFEEILNLYNPVVYDVGDIIDTYVYRIGFIRADYSYAAAMGLFKNIIGLTLLVLTNRFTKKVSGHGIW